MSRHIHRKSKKMEYDMNKDFDNRLFYVTNVAYYSDKLYPTPSVSSMRNLTLFRNQEALSCNIADSSRPKPFSYFDLHPKDQPWLNRNPHLYYSKNPDFRSTKINRYNINAN